MPLALSDLITTILFSRDDFVLLKLLSVMRFVIWKLD